MRSSILFIHTTILFIYFTTKAFTYDTLTLSLETDIYNCKVGYNKTMSKCFTHKNVLDCNVLNQQSIGITDFIARCEADTIILEWHMVSDNNTQLYTIEQSDDGIIWSSIGTFNPLENLYTSHTYCFKDTAFRQQISYYRLSLINNSLEIKYSNLIYIEPCTILKNGDVTIYPNPSGGIFNFIIFSERDVSHFIEVFNSQGQKVYFSDSDIFSIDISENIDGLYYLNYNLNGKNILKKIEVRK